MLSLSEIHGSQLESEENSPWTFASSSVLPSQCPGIHPMHSFRSSTRSQSIGLTNKGQRHGTPIKSKERLRRTSTKKEKELPHMCHPYRRKCLPALLFRPPLTKEKEIFLRIQVAVFSELNFQVLHQKDTGFRRTSNDESRAPVHLGQAPGPLAVPWKDWIKRRKPTSKLKKSPYLGNFENDFRDRINPTGKVARMFLPFVL